MKEMFLRIVNCLFELDLRKVKKDPIEIMNIKFPSEAAQVYSVRQDASLIQYIDDPTEAAQMAAVRQDAFHQSPVRKSAIGSDQKGYRCISVYKQSDREGKI